jgi:hypothetical protein
VIRVKYYWVPRDRIVPMPKPPARMQTVLPHKQFDPQTGELIRVVDSRNKNVVPCTHADEDPNTLSPIHLHDVFYEDYVHDWVYDHQLNALRYCSHAAHSEIWIRCEFED